MEPRSIDFECSVMYISQQLLLKNFQGYLPIQPGF